MITAILVLGVCGLAYWNGANDNSKGVASLLGSGTLRYRAGIIWGTLTTFAGSLVALFVAGELLRRFSGRGLVSDTLAGTEPYVAAVGLGAAGTVLLATRAGLPISTTHALIGAMIGSGWIGAGAVNLWALGTTFLLPLLLSPVLASAAAGALYASARRIKSISSDDGLCICAGEEVRAVGVQGAMATAAVVPSVTVGTERLCADRYPGGYSGVATLHVLDGCHIVSAGLVGFARGMNDAPKLAALLLVLPLATSGSWIALVALAMAAGGLLHARSVARTMSVRITAMSRGQGFAANAATALIVITATLFGLPVSTTHVSVGCLSGIGFVTGQAHPGVIRNVVLSWVATLPCGAVLGALAYLSLG